jgi:hypothetical protein
MNFELCSKSEAIRKGQKWYFTGDVCKNGHIERRYVNTGICYGCKRDRNKVNVNRYPEKKRLRDQKSYKKYRQKRIKASQRWSENNREQSNRIKDKWRQNHKQEVLEKARIRAKKKRQDPHWRLCKNMSKAVWAWLKKSKAFRHWEKQFTEKMNWENYGSYWEVDHIKPLSRCLTFKEAWHLTNLRPLTCHDNRSRGNRVEFY